MTKGGSLIDETAAEWFREHRGIRRETLEHFGARTSPAPETNVPWYQTGDVIFPYSNGEKTRPLNPGERPRFSFTKGVKPALFGGDAKTSTVFLVEGETDAMRLWQELTDVDSIAGVFGISGVNTWRSELVPELSHADKVFVLLDNDDDYLVRAQVDGVWKQIRGDLGPKVKRVHLPSGVKDVCEFFDQGYDLDSLRALCKGAGEASRYKPLDLTRQPPPPNWLVDGLIAKGDVTLIPGPPGVGKSWLTMGLTTAVTEGWREFLHEEMHGSGRVLYVDEENPEDVVYHRLKKLGLTFDGMRNLRYLWNCGIRLDRNPEQFIEEALDYEPTLIVLDSLTRLHVQDENSASSMAALFNEGIQPLARETGAAVVLIHHDNKQGATRGSVDIEASVDAVLHIRGAGESNPGAFVLKQGKSRRRLGGSETNVKVEDVLGDRVQLVASAPLNPPF